MDLENLRAFVAVSNAGTFSGGARALNLAKSTVSQRISDLESSLGVKLLVRTTRSMQLTDPGQELFQRGLDIMLLSGEAEASLTAEAKEVSGIVRLSAPVSLGLRFLGPVIAQLTQQYPKLQLRLELSDRAEDLVGRRFDLALRVGEVSQTGFTVKKLGTARRLVVGSPHYFERFARPCTPSDLAAHSCLRFLFQKHPDVWSFNKGKQESKIRVSGVVESDNGDLLADLASHGVGLAWLPEFIVSPFLKEKRLEVALEQECVSALPVLLVYPEKKFRPLKVQLVAQALEDELKASGLT